LYTILRAMYYFGQNRWRNAIPPTLTTVYFLLSFYTSKQRSRRFNNFKRFNSPFDIYSIVTIPLSHRLKPFDTFDFWHFSLSSNTNFISILLNNSTKNQNVNCSGDSLPKDRIKHSNEYLISIMSIVAMRQSFVFNSNLILSSWPRHNLNKITRTFIFQTTNAYITYVHVITDTCANLCVNSVS